MIQLFASDMDGTILQDHLTIHPDNVKAIHYLQDNGYHFVICTGRDFNQAKMCLQAAKVTCPVIGLNGAAVYDETGHLLWEITISPDDVRQIIQQLEQTGLSWNIVTAKGTYALNFEENFSKRIEKIRKEHPQLSPSEFEIEVATIRALLNATDVTSINEVLDQEEIAIYKILATNEENEISFDPIRSYIEEHMPNLVVTSSFKSNIEINHRDAQKGLAVERYAQTLGLTMDNVFAVGDNSNDVTMLKMAAYGVAMGNGNAEAKEAANYVTTNNTEGGVAKAIMECLAMQND